MRMPIYFSLTHLLPLLLTLTISIGVGNGRIMRWNQNTNYATPTNWDSGHVPCSNERIVFPALSPIVYIQNNIMASEIILPSDGQLIFSDGATISLPGPTSDQSCPQRDVQYIGGDERNMSWFDSRNWCEVSHTGSKCLDPQPARLDLERVPCPSDIVVFPADTSFLVQLGHSVDIHVGGLSIAHQDYTTQTFRNYLKTEIGRKLFVRSAPGGSTPTSVTVSSGAACSDEETGCVCANSNDPALKEKICDVEKGRCKELTCEEALIPASHCCSICGGILLVEYGSFTRVRPLENLAKKAVQQKAPDTGVSAIVSRLPDGEHIQIVVIDDGSDKGMEVAEEIKKLIETDKRGKNKYDVLGVTLQLSGYSSHTERQESSEHKIRPVNIVMICLGLITLFIILAVTIYCTSNNRRPIKDLLPSMPGFVQRTLETRKNRAEVMELGRTVLFNNNVIFESGAGFDNPNFGQGGPEVLDPALLQAHHRYIPAAAAGVEEMQPDFLFNQGSFTNPLYDQPVAAQVHKTPLDDDVTVGTSTAEFPQKGSITKDDGTTGAKAFLDRLRPHKHSKMQEEEENSSDDVTSEKKKDRKNKESASPPADKPDSELGKSRSSKEKKHKKKTSKTSKHTEEEREGVTETHPEEPATPEAMKARKLKLPTGAKTGMHAKLVESSESEESDERVMEMDLGEMTKVKEEEKRDEKKEKKKKMKKEVEESRTGFGNPLYAMDEAERRQQALEEARRRREEGASESQTVGTRLIELEDNEPGESNA